MIKTNKVQYYLEFLLILTWFFVVTSPSIAKEVVIYTSVDQVFSEPILMAFQKKTGIKVKALYDVEAAKTVGLVNRLIAEKNYPKADVFWNSEVGRTILLGQKGVLASYQSIHQKTFPEIFKDRNGYWTGFAARARILIVNTNLLKKEEFPKSIFDLVNIHWRSKVTLANPLFGTTATHVASLYSFVGQKRTEAFLKRLLENEVVIVDGNSVTRDLVVEGRVPVGFTDTDDAHVAILKGKPVKMIYPDQSGMGTLLIPNTVALIKNCPHPENGKKLIDFLLSEEVESQLAFGESAQMPLRKGVRKPPHIPDISEIRAMEVDYYDVADKLERSSKFSQELFIRR